MKMVTYEGFTLQIGNCLAVLTLNCPERLNALTLQMLNLSLPKVFRELRDNDEVHVLVIKGAGGAFCSGADVAELSSSPRVSDFALFCDFASSLYNLDKPVIAAVGGMVAGAGVSVVLLSDIRFASENARFSFAFARRGLILDCGATFLMPRLVGTAKSFELMYTGDVIDAKEAERIGLVNKVVPHDSLMDEVNALAERLAKGPPLALAYIKRAIHDRLINSFEQQLYFESYAQNLCFTTEDFKEGINSFFSKYEPHFKAR